MDMAATSANAGVDPNASNSRPQGTFLSFARLLPELRNSIYTFYFASGSTTGTMLDLEAMRRHRTSLNLVLASHQMCHEALPLWKTADEVFWRSHKCQLPSAVLPNIAAIPRRSREATYKTVLGDIDSKYYHISNVTSLGRLIKPLHRLYIDSPSCPGAMIVVLEAVDRNKTRDTDDWSRAERNDRVYGERFANWRWTRRPHTIIVVSEMNMLQGLSVYLRFVERDRGMIYCNGTSYAHREEPDDSEEGNIFMLEGSRG